MNIQESWEKALRKTEIVRPRVQLLHTSEATHLPYVFLAESSVNSGDTVVRKGEVIVEKPSIIMPYGLPIFDGFEFEEGSFNPDFLTSFLLVRGITFPSFRYNNKTDSLDVHEGRLSEAVRHHLSLLARSEDVNTGLIAGPEDTWQFSVLIFICSQVARQAEGDLKSLFEDYRRKFGGSA